MKKIITLLFVLPIAAICLGQSTDPVEFATGNLNSQQQLLSYQLPRFKPNHGLNRNFCWFSVEYFSGWQQSGVSNQQMIRNAKVNNLEFHDNWNYYYMVSSNIGSYSNNYNDTVNYFNGAMTNIARKNPRLKTSAICFWPQIGSPNASNKNLSPEHYLRNGSGQFLNLDGGVSSTKYWSPVAPNSSIIADGQKQRGYFQNLLTALGRPVNILNENGEILPLISRSGNVINNDPYVRADYVSLGYPSTVTISSANDYRGRKFTDQTNLYRDQFMSLSPSTIFTFYGLDGQIDWRPVWVRARTINTKINGRNYSTGDFYPRWPNNWKGWMGPWHGLGWMADCKYWEEAAGDSLSSPFVCAGWNNDETQNVRPAQYLATLKILSNWGSEFFYSGYFSLSPPFPNPTGWAYQAVMPVYAQAITSRFEPFLRRGYSLPGDVPGTFLGTTLNSDKPKYLFRTGDGRQLVAVRKMYDSEKYIITTAQMVDANTPGNAPNVSYGTFRLGSDSLRVEFRRQGSVYYYDKDAQVFYQLDKWHQREHPERWSKDIEIEAEVSDTLINAQVKTVGAVKTGNTINFTNTTTSVVLSPSAKAEYSFTPRGEAGTKYSVFVRAKARDFNTTNGMTIRIDNWNNINFTCVNDTNYQWYRADNLFTPSSKKFSISTNGNIEIDRFIVTSNPSLIAGAKNCFTTSTGTGPVTTNPIIVKCNPTTTSEMLYVTVYHTENTRGELTVFDSMNRVHFKRRIEVAADGDNLQLINVVNYKAGIYTVTFSSLEGVAHAKFLKR